MKLKKKITDHNHDKYINTQEFNKLTSKNLATRLAQASIASKTDIPDITDFVKKSDFDIKLINFNKKITSNKARYIEIKTKLDDLEKTLN